MGLVFGILTVCAGIGYIIWQYKKENPGMLTLISAAAAIFCGPIVIWNWVIENLNMTVGAIGVSVHCLLAAGFCFYMACGGGLGSNESDEIVRIWNEVHALPLPPPEVIRQYKIANHIPLIPADSEAYNEAAIDAWKRDEYNKRFKQKHRFCVYF